MGGSTSFLAKNGKQIALVSGILGAIIVTATGIYLYQKVAVKNNTPHNPNLSRSQGKLSKNHLNRDTRNSRSRSIGNLTN
jgi:hypothetical protein